MHFTELLREIQATYPKHSRKYHVLATRYYLDVESLEELKRHCEPRECCEGPLPPMLTYGEVVSIINNR